MHQIRQQGRGKFFTSIILYRAVIETKTPRLICASSARQLLLFGLRETVLDLDRPSVLTSQDNEGEDCKVFVSPDGSVQEVMCCDYGFRSGFGRLYQGGDGEIPKNFFALVTTTDQIAVMQWLCHAIC